MSTFNHPVVAVIQRCMSRGTTHPPVTRCTELTRIGLDSLEIIHVFIALEAELGIPVERLASVLHEAPLTVQTLAELYDSLREDGATRRPLTAAAASPTRTWE